MKQWNVAEMQEIGKKLFAKIHHKSTTLTVKK
jgi:hypothetical protein